MNSFLSDLEYSLEERENDLFDSLYYRIFPNISEIEFVEDLKRQKKGIDKVIRFHSGNEFTIDEKKRRKDYGDILLELWSVLERRVRGWLYTCQCDYIVYAVIPSKKAYLLPAILLKRAWFENKGRWLEKYDICDADNRTYTTRNIAVPTEILLEAIYKEMQQKLA